MILLTARWRLTVCRQLFYECPDCATWHGAPGIGFVPGGTYHEQRHVDAWRRPDGSIPSSPRKIMQEKLLMGEFIIEGGAT
jgi:hypothetical protein